ncbi:hypothetical protein CBL_00059 [Carabus blaptoides fortunei]
MCNLLRRIDKRDLTLYKSRNGAVHIRDEVHTSTDTVNFGLGFGSASGGLGFGSGSYPGFGSSSFIGKPSFGSSSSIGNPSFGSSSSIGNPSSIFGSSIGKPGSGFSVFDRPSNGGYGHGIGRPNSHSDITHPKIPGFTYPNLHHTSSVSRPVNSHTNTHVRKPGNSGAHNSTSSSFKPSAPPMETGNAKKPDITSNPHAPSAPPMEKELHKKTNWQDGSAKNHSMGFIHHESGNHQSHAKPGPGHIGWNVTGSGGIQKVNQPGLGNQGPSSLPYPSAPGLVHQPHTKPGPGHIGWNVSSSGGIQKVHQPGLGNQNSPYPAAPGPVLPQYPGVHGSGHPQYPNPPQYPGAVHPQYPQQPNVHYPTNPNMPYPRQPGGPVYAPNYYSPPQYYPSPHLPPPPPGYSAYGIPIIHHSRDSTNDDPNPTTTGAHNTMQMTYYVTPDDKGGFTTSMGNLTCMSVYNMKAVSRWANYTMRQFHKDYPNEIFPLFANPNDTQKVNFTITPGSIVHNETASITCCGTDKGVLDVTKIASGKHPHVNCVHYLGKIPFRKMIFTRIVSQPPAVNMSEWHKITLVNVSSADANGSTPTPLAPFPPTTPSSVDMSQTFSSLGDNITSTPVPLLSNSTESVDQNQTFVSLGASNTSSVDTNQTLDIDNSSSTVTPMIILTNNSEPVNTNETFAALGVVSSSTVAVPELKSNPNELIVT